MIAILVIIMISMICLTIYGGTYYAIMLKNMEKGERKIIKKSGKCPECRVSCPSNPNCPECETCPTTTVAPTTTVGPTTVAPTTVAPTTVAPTTTVALTTTVAPTTTEEPKDENGVPMWAVNVGWPGDDKYLCKVPESCMELRKGGSISNSSDRLSKSECENQLTKKNFGMVTKWCPPIPKISTLIKEMEEKPFMGFINTISGDHPPKKIESKKEYLNETSNGYDTAYPLKVVLKGWTFLDNRVYGYTRNSPGMATARIVGLESGKSYSYRIIIHLTESPKLLGVMDKAYNYRVNGKMGVIHVSKFGSTNIDGSTITNEKGEIVFQFHNTHGAKTDGTQYRIGLSNILIGSPDSDPTQFVTKNIGQSVEKKTLTEEEKYEKKLNELHKDLMAETIIQESRK